MKIVRTLSFGLLALVGCASTGANDPLPSTSLNEAALVAATVVQANNIAHPECTATSATRSKVVESGTHSSMEEWSATCGATTRSYKVLIARLGGGITADVFEDEPIMLQPTAAECVELHRMLKHAQSANQRPTSDLISAHQQVMYKTLACQ